MKWPVFQPSELVKNWMNGSFSLYLCLKIYWSRESLQKIAAAQCFFRAPCNNPLVNCWLLSRMRSTTTTTKRYKSFNKIALPLEPPRSFFLFVSLFCWKIFFWLHFQVTEGIELHHRCLRKKSARWFKVTKTPSILDGEFLQDGLPRPIVEKKGAIWFKWFKVV